MATDRQRAMVLEALVELIGERLGEQVGGAPAELDLKDLAPADKVRMIEAMGFTRRSSSHQPDCPYALDAGNRCNCVPPAPEWGAPQDVLVHLGETYEKRRRRPRQRIPAVERY